MALASAQDALPQETNGYNVHLHMFYGQGCQHCAALDLFLQDIQDQYPSLVVHKHEVYQDQESIALFQNLAAAYSHEVEAVPTVFIGDKVIVGYSKTISDSIVLEVESCISVQCEDPLDRLKDSDLLSEENLAQTLTIPAVISAAAVDAINPCAFAVLIILLTTILASHRKKRALFSGLAFSISIFISYFLMGIGLYSAIQATGLTHKFYLVMAVLAIVLGLFNLKDYLWYGKWFVMEVPLKWRPNLKKLIKGVTSIPGAFFIGFVVSLFLLPCTSGPYIVILGLLSKVATKNYALTLLVLYNIIFVLPMILITFAVYFGITTTEKAEELRQKKLKALHLIAGLIILCLGIGMLIAMWFGII
ncbi:MAG: cytochrome c biogenesis protein [Nanoarchaeota archaeon]|nr:cytochrome c biogenesis protein [Nanoarchaeota archaeon]